jgi:hypothetical protein
MDVASKIDVASFLHVISQKIILEGRLHALSGDAVDPGGAAPGWYSASIQALVYPTWPLVPPRANSGIMFMTSDSAGDPSPEPEWVAEQAALARDVDRAIAEINVIERRLGTPAELPDDMGRAAELAHRVNNLRTSIRLNKGLRGDTGPLEPPVFEAE